MQITFDPTNPTECRIVRDVLSSPMHAMMDPVAGGPWQPETPRADGLTATEQPNKGSGTHDDPYDYSDVKTVEAPVPAHYGMPPAEPDAAPTTEHTAGETDCHGMTHDDAIHSTPASKNADGSWRAKRGQKEAYDAAIAAATQGPAESAPQGMPLPQPASAAPATPPAPIDYKTMAQRFMGKMADPDGLPAEYEAIYAALSIGYDDLETNQTSIARLWNYMDSVDEGNDHDGCVRHAMSA